jgi:hypothetical protein
MKNKELIFLFIFFLGVVILSLLITQQSQKAVSLAEQKILITEPAGSTILPVYSPQVSSAPIVKLPLAQSGITIIKASSTEPEEKSIHASNITDEAVNNESSRNVGSNSQAQDVPAATTTIGKKPAPKETQEMNSSGIVMY